MQTGNNVSHAHNKTRRRFIPNLQKVSLISETLGKSFSMRLSVAAIRTVEKLGGLDAYLMKASNEGLGTEALRIKKRVKKQLVAKAG